MVGGKGCFFGFDIYLKYKSKQTQRLCLDCSHMQDMSLIDKQKQLFLRRKHKLFKSLTHPPHPPIDIYNSPQKDFINLYEMILNK